MKEKIKNGEYPPWNEDNWDIEFADIIMTPDGDEYVHDDEKDNDGEEDNVGIIKMASESYVDSYKKQRSLKSRNSDLNIMSDVNHVTLGNMDHDKEQIDTDTDTDGYDDDESNPNIGNDEFVIDDEIGGITLGDEGNDNDDTPQ